MNSENKISLSYVLTTFNKINYIKATLPYLIANKKRDEEIIVVDGGSNDGTAEYLENLLQLKNIDQFITEKDYGEAHGTNKGFLMSKGELIKIITDDDIYHFPGITKCKEFMLANPEIDILASDGSSLNITGKHPEYKNSNFIKGFYEWKKNKKPFLFCGLSILVRKKSLSYLGLFNPRFKIVDMEYSIRITNLKIKIAFFEGLMFLNVVNPQSNSYRFYKTLEKERFALQNYFPGKWQIRINHFFNMFVFNLVELFQRNKKIDSPVFTLSYLIAVYEKEKKRFYEQCKDFEIKRIIF